MSPFPHRAWRERGGRRSTSGASWRLESTLRGWAALSRLSAHQVLTVPGLCCSASRQPPKGESRPGRWLPGGLDQAAPASSPGGEGHSPSERLLCRPQGAGGSSRSLGASSPWRGPRGPRLPPLSQRPAEWPVSSGRLPGLAWWPAWAPSLRVLARARGDSWASGPGHVLSREQAQGRCPLGARAP